MSECIRIVWRSMLKSVSCMCVRKVMARRRVTPFTIYIQLPSRYVWLVCIIALMCDHRSEFWSRKFFELIAKSIDNVHFNWCITKRIFYASFHFKVNRQPISQFSTQIVTYADTARLDIVALLRREWKKNQHIKTKFHTFHMRIAVYHLQMTATQKKLLPYLCGSFKLIAKNFVHLIEVFLFSHIFLFI